MTSRRVLLATTAAVALVGSGAGDGLAQPSDKIEKVTVTGTRIKQPNNTNAVSTQTIGERKIELSGEANVVDVLRDLPIVGVPGLSSQNSNFLTSNNGINTLDLRELGSDRTLVLVNGRRFIAGVALTQQVDFNSIPTELIERIDVLSGGSSAVYGSDAVAGVVNVILKRNFEGVSTNIQTGATAEYPEADNYLATATVGGNFAEDKGNAVLNIGYSRTGPAFARSRPENEVDCLSGRFAGGSAFTQNCPFFSGFSVGGRYRFSSSTGAASILRVIDHVDGVTLRPTVTEDGFNRQGQRLNLVPSERYQLTGLLDYEVVPGHTMFAEVSWANTNSNAQIEPFPLQTDDIFGASEQVGAQTGQRFGVAPNNPYVPRPVLDLLGSRFGIVNPQLLSRADLVAQLMAIPGAAIGFQRRMSEAGNREVDFRSQTGRFVVGLEGPIGSWDYEVSINYGRTQNSQVANGSGISQPNFREALNAVDRNLDLDNNPLTNPQDVVCANPSAVLEGCVPINIFTPARSPAAWIPQQINYISGPVFRDQSQEQLIISGSATGALFEAWAGDIEGAVGGEYRREVGADQTDALTRTGQNSGNVAPATSGSFDVWEAFGELKVPLVRDVPLIKELNIHGAIRASEYSSFGFTKAWSADAEWIVQPGVRLRGQIGRAVRAPNIGDLFTGASENFAVVVDLCNNLRTDLGGGNTLPNRPTDPTIIANCLANPGILARANTPTGFVLSQLELQGTGGFGQGNPNLQPEQSDSQQFGIVVTPDFWGNWFGNLTMSADYFVVDVADAIGSVSRNQTIRLCYTTPGLASPFCNPTPGGPIGLVRNVNGALIQVNTAQANVNQVETDGFEVQLNYSVDVAKLFGNSAESELGQLSLSGVWQHVNTYNTTSLAGTPLATLIRDVDTVGLFSDEVNLGAVYSIGDLTLSWSGQWMGEATGVDDQGDLGLESIPSQWFHDLSGTYDVTEYLSVYGGVRNVADNYVFIGPGAFAATPTGFTTAPDTYDGLGRRYFFGVRVKM